MGIKGTNNTIQALWVAVGNFCALGVSILSAMVLSRYFNKEDYGVYRQVLFVYTTILTVFTLGLPRAYSYFIPREKPQHIRSLIDKIEIVFYILGLIFSISLYIFSTEIAIILSSPKLEIALKYFSPVPFFLLPTMGIEGIFASFQRNQLMMIYNIISKTLIFLCVTLPVIIFGGTYKDAIIGFAIASFLSYLLSIALKKKCVILLPKEKSPTKYSTIFAFAIPMLFACLWGLLFNSADKYFISRYFGPEIFAEYSNGAMPLPFVSMIVASCSTVLMPLFSKIAYNKDGNKKEILSIWMSVFAKTVKITYPLVLFCIFYATEIMVIIYGEKYTASGTYFLIELFVNLFTVISYYPVVIAIGCVRYYRDAHMYGALALILLCWLCVTTLHSSLVLAGIVVLIRIAIIIFLLMLIAKYFELSVLKIIPFSLILKLCMLSCSLLIIIKLCFGWLRMPLMLSVITQFAIFICLYALSAYRFHIDYYSIFRPIINRIKK